MHFAMAASNRVRIQLNPNKVLFDVDWYANDRIMWLCIQTTSEDSGNDGEW